MWNIKQNQGKKFSSIFVCEFNYVKIFNEFYAGQDFENENFKFAYFYSWNFGFTTWI